MEELLEILKGINDTVDFASENAIIDDGIIDSIDLTGLISELEDAFNIEIDMDEIVAENFNTVDAMWKMITRLQGNN